MDDLTLMRMLRSTDEASYDVWNAMKEISKREEISDELFDCILGIQDCLELGNFLISYYHLSETQIARLNTFIKANLHHEDKMFVSDLVEAASYWNFKDIWDECIAFVSTPETNSYITMFAIPYLYENMEIWRIMEVKEVLDEVIENENYYQDCQVLAAFYLFRLTMDKKYLEELESLLQNKTSINRNVLARELKLYYNQPEYFAYHDHLKNLTEN